MTTARCELSRPACRRSNQEESVTDPSQPPRPLQPAPRLALSASTVVEHMSFNVGNAIKYLWRADKKAHRSRT